MKIVKGKSDEASRLVDYADELKAFYSAAGQITGGVHEYDAGNYLAPDRPELQERIEWFKDQKLALMIHFGLYSQLGIPPSWPMVQAEASWARAEVDWETDHNKILQQYSSLNRSFNPVRFQPEFWADVAKNGGFKYVIFTTKHHDGFCLYDSQFTDYKSTGADCPFSSDKNADIVKNVFNAFRARGLGIGAYFSKPDWHSDYFWHSGGCLPTGFWRYPNYDVRERADLWDKFRNFTKSQIIEIVKDYGPVDILWLDGGQVQKRCGLDINMSDIAEEARKINPRLLIVNRTAGGEFENYLTPELTVPEKPLNVPWEACTTIGASHFGYRYDDEYMCADKIILMLLDIVSKGGNLALNIAPQPDGRFPACAVVQIAKLGEWLSKYGEGIYGTRPVYPYKQNGIFYTGKANVSYAFSTNTTIMPALPGRIERMSDTGESITVYKIKNV